MVDAIQGAIIGPQLEIVVDRAFRRQIFRDRAPLVAGRQNVHEAIHHLTHDHRALVSAALAGGDQRFERKQLPAASRLARRAARDKRSKATPVI